MSDIQKKFYVLRAISGKENKVREYLEAERKNTDLDCGDRRARRRVC